MSYEKIIIYTDGACEGNQFQNNYGGWGVVVLKEKPFKKISGAIRNTTNNRMELTACIEALLFVQDNSMSGLPHIYTDSAYIVNCFTQRWYVKWRKNEWKNSKGNPVENKDLWVKLLALVDTLNVSFHKVQAHIGNIYNEMADQLAVDAIQKLKMSKM